MKNFIEAYFKTIIWIIAVLTIFVGLSFVELYYKGYFGVKDANIEREIFENNESYIRGKVNDLARYKNEYEQNDTQTGKNSIKQRIINEFANFDINKLQSSNLRSFLERMRGY
jgi:hypothetical protein